jgi:DNA-binding transcriptional MerR regulator
MGEPARERDRYPYRMKDLCDLTGLSRQAIHFYIQQGLLPPGHKTGRNMAWYGPEHVERLELVRRLQHERFLPLKAIRAMLAGDTDEFSPEQRSLLRDIRARLAGSELDADAERDAVDLAAVAERAGVEPAEIRRMAELGLVAVAGDGEHARIAADDAWIIELWGQIRALGFSEELGFGVEDMTIYEDAVSRMFTAERKLLLDRLAHLPPERSAEMITRVLPLIHTFITRYHNAQVRTFFSIQE